MNVQHVEARVEAFLRKFARDMRRLGERALAATRTALVQLKHTIDYELKEEVERNWREIVSMEYKFQRLFSEANAIEKIRVGDIKTWVEDHFPSGNKSHLRKLSVQVMGHVSKKDNTTEVELKSFDLTYLDANNPIGDSTENAPDFIKDIRDFKKDLPFIDVPQVKLAQC